MNCFSRAAAIAVSALASAFLSNCGGGNFPPAGPTAPSRQLISVAVQPANALAVQGETFPFTATGTFDQAPTTQTNFSAQWTSSDTNVATINATGVATCVGVGNPVTINASSAGKNGTVQASATLSCQIPLGNAIQADPNTLKFTCVRVGLMGECGCTLPQITTLTNTTAASLGLNSIAINGQHFFLDSTTCGAHLAAGQSCTATVRYAPQAAATNASLEINDSGDALLQRVSLDGGPKCP